MQLEGVIAGLSEKSVPAVLIKLEEGKGTVVELLSLPTPLRPDIPFCIRRVEGSILTPNRRWLCGSVLPSWSIEHSLPGKGGNEIEFEERLV
jgi:hypothetical protein